jgi:hypothetical protein
MVLGILFPYKMFGGDMTEECKGPMLHMKPPRGGLPAVCGFKCETCGTSLVREEDDW